MVNARLAWDDRFTGYDFGVGHPMHPLRLWLTHRLLDEFGVLDDPGLEVCGVDPADRRALETVHSPDLIDAVQRFAADPGTSSGAFGIGTDDTPAFPGMHDATSMAVGGTLEMCRAVWAGEVAHGVNIAGGLHHAMPDRSSGFCVYNDIAVGIQWMLDQGAERVVYLDLDVHHGDGVQAVFWDDPRVLTISIHESGNTLFPGTGYPNETGGPSAPDSAVNIALPAGTGDEAWLRALRSVVPAVIRAFGPQVIVSQHGCDAHHADPLSHLALTLDAMTVAYEDVHALAHEVSDGRWVALGGGGYELINVVPRAWAQLTAIAAHRPIPLDAAIPTAWREHVQRSYGHSGPSRMGDRSGDPIRVRSWSDGYDPEDEVDRAILATRRATFPGHGLDPHFD